jgi:DNA-binding NarL/FixJ family response regulator
MEMEVEAARLVLVEDHPIVRDGLRAIFAGAPDFTIVGESGDGLEAVDVVKQLKPDLLVLDLMLPSLHGLEVIRQVRQHVPACRILVLSMHENDAYAIEALRSGASGYVLKAAPSTELLLAAREVTAGRRYLSAALAKLTGAASSGPLEAQPRDPYDDLSNRERQVLQLVAEGYSNSAIAARLHISPRTVEVHRANLMRKLKLESANALVRFAIKRGLVSLNE